jgi:predicted PurR-regulated permease PerM
MKEFLPFLLIATVLYGLGSSLVPLLLAGIAALLCEPYIQWLKTKGVKKPYSTLLIILGVFLPIIIFNAILLPIMLQEAKEFLTELPTNMTKLLDQIESWAVTIGVSLDYNRKDVLELVEAHISKLSVSILKSLTEILKQSAGNMTQVLITVLNIFLIPIFFFYLVTEKNYWAATIKAIIPREHHARTLETLKSSIAILKSYMQGQVLACVILALIYSIGLQAVGLKFGILIGIITGSLTFIPYVGFSIGLALGLIVAVSAGGGISYIALVFAVFMVGQALETFVITPKFVGKNVGLTSLESILVLIIFGNLFGFVGMVVAIPTGAIIKTTLTKYVASQ